LGRPSRATLLAGAAQDARELAQGAELDQPPGDLLRELRYGTRLLAGEPSASRVDVLRHVTGA
jgi:hypothetical protein